VETNEEALANPKFYHDSVQKLSDIIVYDIFSPLVASRNYVYPNIAAYEVIAATTDQYNSLSGQLTDFSTGPEIGDQEISPAVAALEAFITTAKHFIFSEQKLLDYQVEMYQNLKDQGISKKIFNNSVEYGKAVAAHVIEYSGSDNYKKLEHSQSIQ